MHRTIDGSGAGVGGARNISGPNREHVQLEAELAGLHGKETALIFTSGWLSNLAAPGTLGRLMPGCAIFSDALDHNSIIGGIRRSGAERSIFRHSDVVHLDELMRSIEAERPKIVAFESVPFHSDEHMRHLIDALVAVRAQLDWPMAFSVLGSPPSNSEVDAELV